MLFVLTIRLRWRKYVTMKILSSSFILLVQLILLKRFVSQTIFSYNNKILWNDWVYIFRFAWYSQNFQLTFRPILIVTLSSPNLQQMKEKWTWLMETILKKILKFHHVSMMKINTRDKHYKRLSKTIILHFSPRFLMFLNPLWFKVNFSR